MVKLDAHVLRFLTKDDFRVLTAVEMGMKNHDLVPTQLITAIAKLKFGGTPKALSNLHKNKLVYHENKKYDGYRLTYAGYDYLALKTFTLRESVSGVGRKIGVGKESDIYIVINDKNEEMALKFHRLGRTSFRTVKNNRDYLKHRKSASWFYLSRLAAIKEFAYMKALYDAGFPVPRPVDFNRHCVLMSLVKATPLCNVRELQNPEKVYGELMDLLVKLANHGLIHGDFNEFNILINDDEEITLIDFPQMVSIEHENAEMYFNRDVNCIRTYFKKRYDFDGLTFPVLGEDTYRQYSLDSEIQASGFDKGMQEMFEKLTREQEGEENEEGSEEEGETGSTEETEESGEDSGDENNEDVNNNNNNEDKAEKNRKRSNKNKKADLDNELVQNVEKALEKLEVKENNENTAENNKNDVNNEKEGEKNNNEEKSGSGSDSDSEEEGEMDEEMMKRKAIQERVKRQIARRTKEKLKIRNSYKSRQKRKIREETNIDNWK